MPEKMNIDLKELNRILGEIEPEIITALKNIGYNKYYPFIQEHSMREQNLKHQEAILKLIPELSGLPPIAGKNLSEIPKKDEDVAKKRLEEVMKRINEESIVSYFMKKEKFNPSASKHPYTVGTYSEGDITDMSKIAPDTAFVGDWYPGEGQAKTWLHEALLHGAGGTHEGYYEGNYEWDEPVSGQMDYSQGVREMVDALKAIGELNNLYKALDVKPSGKKYVSGERRK